MEASKTILNLRGVENDHSRDLKEISVSALEPDLIGCRVLVVEDDLMIAVEIMQALQICGAEIAGPVPTVDHAMRLIKNEGHRVSAAVLDINLRGEMSFGVAEALRRRNIPFLFATGYERSFIPEQYRDVPHFMKPLEPNDIARALGHNNHTS